MIPWSSLANFEREEAIISALKANPSVTQEQLCKLLRVDHKTLKPLLDDMVTSMKIQRINYGNAYAYVIGGTGNGRTK
jgi:DeoR/GlpR family transcriptional regulator of sugar metabolism